jgi:hypothetical protein
LAWLGLAWLGLAWLGLAWLGLENYYGLAIFKPTSADSSIITVADANETYSLPDSTRRMTNQRVGLKSSRIQ